MGLKDWGRPPLKAVILAAGRTKTEKKYWFPENSKPKCLFHIGEKTILQKMVDSIRLAGIEDIRVVTGYHSEDVVEYNRQEGLNLELVYNPDWEEDATSSLFVGLRDIDDDVLLLMGDIIVDYKVLLGFVRRVDDELIWLKMTKPYAKYRIYPECRDKNICIVKIGKNKLNIFDGVDGEQLLRKFGWKSIQGNQIYALIYEAFRHNNPAEVTIMTPLKEIDYYRQTTERRQELRKLKA